AFAATGVIPAASRDGNVSSVPPPAIEFIRPAPRAERKRRTRPIGETPKTAVKAGGAASPGGHRPAAGSRGRHRLTAGCIGWSTSPPPSSTRRPLESSLRTIGLPGYFVQWTRSSDAARQVVHGPFQSFSAFAW